MSKRKIVIIYYMSKRKFEYWSKRKFEYWSNSRIVSVSVVEEKIWILVKLRIVKNRILLTAKQEKIKNMYLKYMYISFDFAPHFPCSKIGHLKNFLKSVDCYRILRPSLLTVKQEKISWNLSNSFRECNSKVNTYSYK